MALRVMGDQTLADFHAAEQAGADIVIVPAQASPKAAGAASTVDWQAQPSPHVHSGPQPQPQVQAGPHSQGSQGHS
jgi:hypothetical protein